MSEIKGIIEYHCTSDAPKIKPDYLERIQDALIESLEMELFYKDESKFYTAFHDPDSNDCYEFKGVWKHKKEE